MQAPTLNPITQGSHLETKAVDHAYGPDPYVYAPEDAEVIFYGQAGTPGTKDDAGNQLRIYGKSGTHAFSHLEKAFVSVTNIVRRGQKIALMGYTGYTQPDNTPAGAHLHYWLRQPNTIYVYPPSLYKDNFIKEQEMITSRGQMKSMWRQYLGRSPTEAEYIGWIGKRTYADAIDKLTGSRKDLPGLILENSSLKLENAHLKEELSASYIPVVEQLYRKAK